MKLGAKPRFEAFVIFPIFSKTAPYNTAYIEIACSLLFQTPVKSPFVITFAPQQTVM